MIRCRSRRCLEKQKEIVRKIMLTIPEEFRFNYKEVKKRAKPFVQKQEWLIWKYEQENK